MSNFTVTAVIERPTLNAAGALVNSTIMYIETLMGNTGSLELPTKNFEALTSSQEGKDALREMLQAKADSLDTPLSF